MSIMESRKADYEAQAKANAKGSPECAHHPRIKSMPLLQLTLGFYPAKHDETVAP